MTCWSCRAPPWSALPPGTDLFQVLGLPRGFAIDPTDLERRFRERSRQFHPDRFAQASSPERRISLARSTAVNDAYRTLRDPVRRAVYLLKLHGLSVDSEDRSKGAPAALPPEFLEEIMALREGFLDAETPERREEMVGAVREQQAAAMRSMEHRLTTLGETPAPQALQAAGEDLAKLRYFERFLAEAVPPPREEEIQHP
jgi:molecular chaperone HscB